ncbi:MAG: hypothetical protein HY795_06520 [Desulfovibrio sp.]|nr:hypothetical protein [Desulfovibrio sp.]MBI4961247.1 hypothetical protein [Desulfovibrio sp.]
MTNTLLGQGVSGARLQESGSGQACPRGFAPGVRTGRGRPAIDVRIRLVSLAVVLVAAWALPPSARAHGTGSRWLDGGQRALAVYFHYSGGEPMAWNKVKVFGPGDEKTEFVAARTDRNGRFAFLPDRPGLWRVEVADDEGHKAVAETDYHPASPPASQAAPSEAAAPGTGPASGNALPDNARLGPLWLRILLGVSLTLNLFVGAAFLKRKP